MIGKCPICGEQTEGIHIAGTVYDFQCDTCVAEADRNFDRFVDSLIEATPESETQT